MSIGLALNLLDAAVEQGGGTFYADGRLFTRSGYIVGGKAPTLKLKHLTSGPKLVSAHQVERVAAWIDANRSRMYGSWLDDGTIYIDAVDVFDEREDAILVGKTRGELAIYDMAAGEDIRLDGGESDAIPGGEGAGEVG